MWGRLYQRVFLQRFLSHRVFSAHPLLSKAMAGSSGDGVVSDPQGVRIGVANGGCEWGLRIGVANRGLNKVLRMVTANRACEVSLRIEGANGSCKQGM